MRDIIYDFSNNGSSINSVYRTCIQYWRCGINDIIWRRHCMYRIYRVID